jgi:hypothetical protein
VKVLCFYVIMTIAHCDAWVRVIAVFLKRFGMAAPTQRMGRGCFFSTQRKPLRKNIHPAYFVTKQGSLGLG